MSAENAQRGRRINGGVKPCSKCGAPSWNAALNPGEPCLPCKRKTSEEGR